MRWTAYTRADGIDPGLARSMAEAGCYCLALGVETGSQDELDSINKSASVNDYKKGIKIIKDAGMDVHTLIIFGFPEVKHGDIQMAAKFLMETEPTMSQFFIFHPVPGTEYFASPEKFGLHYNVEKINDWYKFDFIEEPLCDTKHLNREEIIKYFILYNIAFKSYENLGEDPDLQQRLLRNAIPRRRKEVVFTRTGKINLYSSPFLHANLKYADLYKNTCRLDDIQYEVLLRCNGDFAIEEIAEVISKLFNFSEKNSLIYIVNALYKFEQLKLIYDFPGLKELNHLIMEECNMPQEKAKVV